MCMNMSTRRVVGFHLLHHDECEAGVTGDVHVFFCIYKENTKTFSLSLSLSVHTLHRKKMDGWMGDWIEKMSKIVWKFLGCFSLSFFRFQLVITEAVLKMNNFQKLASSQSNSMWCVNFSLVSWPEPGLGLQPRLRP